MTNVMDFYYKYKIIVGFKPLYYFLLFLLKTIIIKDVKIKIIISTTASIFVKVGTPPPCDAIHTLGTKRHIISDIKTANLLFIFFSLKPLIFISNYKNSNMYF